MPRRNKRETQKGIGGLPPQARAVEEQGPIRVSFGVYIISLLIVALVIFIVMLVMYLPGYRMSNQLRTSVKNAEYVYIGIRIPKSELKERKVNPLTKEDDLVEMLKEMGAKRAKAEINPDLTKIPGE